MKYFKKLNQAFVTILTYRVGPLNSTLLVKNQAKFYMVIAVYPKQKCDQDNLPGNLKWGSKSPFMKYS